MKRPLKPVHSLLIFLLSLLTLATVVTSTAAEELTKYCNSRYGFCLYYPKSLKMQPPPTNNDGRIFQDRDGFVLTASGMNNFEDHSLQNEMNEQRTEFDTITYEKTGKNWFVLSGHSGSEILYIKAFVGRGSINHLEIRCPARLKSRYDKVVELVVSSFRPGPLEDSH